MIKMERRRRNFVVLPVFTGSIDLMTDTSFNFKSMILDLGLGNGWHEIIIMTFFDFV